MIVAVRARQYGKDALQELALLGLVAEVAVGDAKIEQRDGHFRVVAAVLALLDRERALQHVSRLGVVA